MVVPIQFGELLAIPEVLSLNLDPSTVGVQLRPENSNTVRWETLTE